MDEKDVQAILQKIKDIPTLPLVVTKIMRTVDNPDSSAEDLNKIISMDQALTSKVLRLVNSAFYGFPQKINTLSKAVVILGFKTIRSLALSVSVFEIFKRDSANSQLDHAQFWKHSLATAIGARSMAKKVKPAIADEVFIAALMHDIGHLVLDQFAWEQFGPALQKAKNQKILLYQAERELMGTDHCKIGKLLGEKWHLPANIILPIQFHHQPHPSRQFFEETALTHAADTIAKCLNFGSVGDNEAATTNQINSSALNLLKISDASSLLGMRDEIKLGLDDAADFLNMATK